MKKTDFSRLVYEQINSNNLRIKPRSLFVLGGILLMAGIIGVVFVAVFVFNLVFFHFRSLHHQVGLNLNVLFSNFPQNFPLIPILVIVICIGAGIVLLRQFRAIYSRNFWLILGGFLLISVLLALVLLATPLNEKLLETPFSNSYCGFGLGHCERHGGGHHGRMMRAN